MKMKIFKQLGFFNAALFLAEWAALEYFGMKACLLFPDWSGDLMWWGEMIFTAFLFVLVVEAVLILRLDAANPKPFLTPLLLTHLPWLAGIGLTRFAVLAFPPPHDFLLRKIQVLFGLMWMAHLFLFSGWILWRCWRSGRKASIVFAWVGAFFLAGSALWTSR